MLKQNINNSKIDIVKFNDIQITDKTKKNQHIMILL